MYNYQTERPKLFTEQGIELVRKVQQRMDELFSTQKVILMEDIISRLTGSSWEMMAAVDYLKEKRYLYEISGQGVVGQYRVFVKTF